MAIPNWWWTGTEAKAGTETPQEGWIPITTGDNYTDIYSSYLNPTYTDPYLYDTKTTREYDIDTGWTNAVENLYYTPEQVRSWYGITYGDPYAETVQPEQGTEEYYNSLFDPNINPEEVFGSAGEGNNWVFSDALGYWTPQPIYVVPETDIIEEDAYSTIWPQYTAEQVDTILSNISAVPDLPLPEGYEWDMQWNADQTAQIWTAKKIEQVIDYTPEPVTIGADVWSSMESTINQYQDIIAEALKGLDLDFNEQQSILDALTSKILGYESPDLTGEYSAMDDLVSRIENIDTGTLDALRDQLIALANE